MRCVCETAKQDTGVDGSHTSCEVACVCACGLHSTSLRTTSETLRPDVCARLPRIEKIAKPPVSEKMELDRATMRHTRNTSSLGLVYEERVMAVPHPGLSENRI